MRSYPIYRNKSIVAAITPRSENVKTGDMAQLYILPRREPAHKAVQAGRDRCVCGDCPLRSKASGGSGACYVVTAQGPREVWNAVRGRKCQEAETNKPIRLGAYGDPAFLPLSLVAKLVQGRKWTGYTHQWHKRTAKWAKYLMASIDGLMAKRQGLTSLQLKRKANNRGYRTFRVIQPLEPIDADEILCPNYTKGVKCIDCGLCNGAGPQKNIAIYAHGSGKGDLNAQ